MYGDHMTGWGWAIMGAFWALGVASLGLLLWAAGRWAGRTLWEEKPTARELLDERLALGDIDPDEYARRKEALERGTAR